ncbi:MAG: hypothetical protein WD511_00025 [Balneolaceae bacterium]
MNNLTIDAAWVLVVTFSLSLLYEIYRATLKAGTSRHDSLRTFFTQDLPLYIISAIVITILFAGYDWSAWVGLIFSVVLILLSIFYYNPVIMMERKPGLIDWFEDLVYTGLLFVASALLIYEIAGK